MKTTPSHSPPEHLWSHWSPHSPLGTGVNSTLKTALQQPHTITRIHDGDDNLGIFLHDFTNQQCRGDMRLIIEKRTAYRFEYCLGKQLLHRQAEINGSPFNTTFPKVYGVAISQKRFKPVYHLYMELLPDSHSPQDITPCRLEELALCSVRLHAILPQLTKGFELRPRRRLLTRHNYSRLQQLFRSDSSSPVARLAALDQLLSRLPLAFAHTDLSWRNVRTVRTSVGNITKAFDFAWARQLPVGVEWHHFASSARGNPEEAERFHYITSYYASLLGMDPRHVRACASLFALHVSLICRLGPKGHAPIPDEMAEAARQDTRSLCEQAIASLQGGDHNGSAPMNESHTAIGQGARV